MSATQPETPTPETALLFTRQNLKAINERCGVYILQRGYSPRAAWAQAIEDEAQIVEHKLSLMQEGALQWDWQGRQLQILRDSVDYIATI